MKIAFDNPWWTSNCALTGWLKECMAPNPFWKAVEPIDDAANKFCLASIFFPSLKAFKSEFLINFIPSKAIPSAIGWKFGAHNASRLCANASIPVAAVSLGESSIVKDGSRITIEGKILGWNIIFLTPVFLFIIAEARPVSDPVPAVVGIAIIGEILFSFALFQ